MPDEPNTLPKEERESSLEQLENRLYSRTPPPVQHNEEFGREERRIRIQPGWSEEAERKESALLGILSKIMPWLNRLLVASIVFFLFAGAVALVGFARGGNTVSPQKISLSALGPASAPAGEELFFEITVGNYNDTLLQSVDLVVEYPDGTRKPGALSEPLLRYRESLGALAPRGTVSRRLSLVPFGEEGAEKKITVKIEYRPKDSNAIFSRESVYPFLINAAPVAVLLSAPREVSSGQPFDITVEVVSNTSSIIKNLLIKAEFPAGFRLTKSSPAASFGDNTWQMGDLAPEARQTLRMTGRIDAGEEEERAFRFFVGTASPKDEKSVGTIFLIEAPSILIAKSFLSLDAILNGERGEKFVAPKTGQIRTDIPWANNLAVKITDLEITAQLQGELLDRASVVGSGRYDATAGTIVWDKQQRTRFAVVDPGASGTESFSFSLLSAASDPSRFRNASLMLHVFARGKRLDELGAAQDVIVSLSKEIKVASVLALGTRLQWNAGPFTNSGPLPPRAGEETTYTIVWSLSNSSNSVSRAEVVAALPTYVRWLGMVSPASELMSYNPEGGEVVWNAGEIALGVGFGVSPREVAFQVALLPSKSQIGSSPTVIGAAQARATDRFTATEVLSNARPALTTGSLSEGGDGVVVK